MIALRFRSHLSSSHLLKRYRNGIYPLTFPQIHTEISRPNKSLKNLVLYNYLIDALSFPKEKAIKISNRFRCISSLEQHQSVVDFFKSFGFTHSQIQSAVNVCPQLLFSDTGKILGPKLRFFQELGFSGSDFGKFIAKNSSVLTLSLDDTLKPGIEIVKKIIGNDENNKNLIEVLLRCNWVLKRTSSARIVSNVLYFKSLGIDDNQLSKTFTSRPRLLAMSESELRVIVEKVSKMGFPMHSRMLIYAIFTVSTMTSETLERKLELMRSFGFSKHDCMEMFRKAPSFLRTSEVKLRFAMEFLLDTVKLKKSVIVHMPTCLMHNMEDRLVARYRVVKTLMEKGLLKKEPAFLGVLHLPEGEFLDKYISRFVDNAEELLYCYKGHLESSTEEKEV